MNPFRRFDSIRGRLLLMVLSILVPILLIQAVIYKNRFETRLAEELQANLELAQAVGLAFNKYIENILDQELSMGAALPSMSREEAIRFLSFNQQAYPAIRSFSWVDPSGDIILSTFPSAQGINIQDREYFQQIKTGRETYVSNLLQSKTTGEEIILISRGIRDESGNLQGMLMAALEPEKLDRVLTFHRVREGAIVFLDRTGRLVFRSPSTDLTWEERDLLARFPVVRRALRGEDVTGMEERALQNRARVYALTPMSEIGWVAGTSRTEAEVLAPIYRQFWQAGLFLAVVLLSLPLAALVARSISSPVRRIRERALQVGGQENGFEEKISGPTEIQELYTTLQRMTKELQDVGRLAEERYVRLEASLRSAAEGIVFYDANHIITRMNPAAERILGFSEEEVRRPLDERMQLYTVWKTDGESPGLQELPSWRALQGENVQHEELIFSRKDSHYPLHLLTSAAPVRMPDGSVVGAIQTLTDITERKKTEEALRKNEKLLQNVLDVLPIGVFIADETGQIARMNPAVEKIWAGARHVPMEKFREYKGWWKETGKRIDSHEWAFARAFAKGEISINEVIEIECFDGARKTILNSAAPVRDSAGNIVSAVAVIMDISDRIEAERALRESEERYRLVNLSTHDVIWDWDLKTDRLKWDGMVHSVFGVTREELGPYVQEWYNRIHPDERERVVKSIHASIESNSNFWTDEYRFWCEPDEWRVFLDRGHIARDDSGVAYRMIGSMQDVTERKKAEEQLRELANELEDRVRGRTLELEQANRAKDEFLANMSHEIRTPMAGVMGITDLILQQNLSERSKSDIELIRSSAATVLSLLNDMLDLSRIEQGRMELHEKPFDLKDMLEDIARTFEMQAQEKEIGFGITLHPDLPDRIVCDPGRLGQVLKNLLSNAVKFTESGGVRLDVRPAKQTDHFSRLRFTVSDTGIGIPENRIEDIFQSFTQIDPTYSKKFAGAGLGLAISKRLIDLMKGAIDVESEPGKGSTFIFTVTFEKPEEVEEPKEHPFTLADLPPLSILLAEDNPVNRLFLHRSLANEGHTVTDAVNGVEALEKLQNERFDLILMDIQMPEMDGVEATREIRKNGLASGIPIIALTAYAMKGDREKFLGAGMDGYVSKPIDFEELARVIGEITGKETGGKDSQS